MTRCGYNDYDFSETPDTQTVEDFELLAVIKAVKVGSNEAFHYKAVTEFSPYHSE